MASLLQLKRAFPPLDKDEIREALIRHSKIGVGMQCLHDPVNWIVENYFPIGWAGRHSWLMRCSINNKSCLEGSTVLNPDNLALSDFDSLEIQRGAGTILLRDRVKKVWHDSTKGSVSTCVKAVGVQDAGKIRVITKGSRLLKNLQPLQLALHSHLKTYPEFALIGRPIKPLGPLETCDLDILGPSHLGEVLSVDYTNATDDVDGSFQSRLIVEIINRSGSKELEDLLETARRECSLGRRIHYKDRSVIQRKGTLMGSLLSFPLLCLTNAYIIRCATKNPFLVNGDDAAFRCRRDEREVWETTASELGMKPSPGKVYHSDRFITLCSRYFTFRGGKFREVDFTPVSLYLAPMSGSSWNAIPVRYQNLALYKFLSKKPIGDCRNLIGPVCFGGMGGELPPSDELVCQELSLDRRNLDYLRAANMRMRPLRFAWQKRRHPIYDDRHANLLSWLLPKPGFAERPPHYFPVNRKRLTEEKLRKWRLHPGVWKHSIHPSVVVPRRGARQETLVQGCCEPKRQAHVLTWVSNVPGQIHQIPGKRVFVAQPVTTQSGSCCAEDGESP
jgi:hypothetical protein